MTVSEIFSKISAHMVKGIMFHSQMADYYMFLGMPKYAECHEKRYEEENHGWRKLCKYYMTHCNKFIKEIPIESPKAIPETWYKYFRQEVDNNTKMKAVKTGLDKWVEWETETKKMYEEMYYDLFSQKEISLAMFLKRYVKDVDDELCKAMSYQLHKTSIDYDLKEIMAEQ